jgi:hypothetical protein
MLRIHRGAGQLFRIHFTQTFVTLRVNGAFVASGVLFDKTLALLIVPAVFFYFAFFAEIERGICNLQEALLDERLHVAEEESHYQSVDVTAVHIGVGHDDDLVVA